MLVIALCVMKSRFNYIACFLLFFSVLPIYGQEVYLCVWRNPERTMTRIFPEARDYKTVNVRISPEKQRMIEQVIGYELLPGQQDQFQYFEMTDKKGQVIGTIIPSTQKGEFGAVEFVFGLGPDLKIKNLYIQRARERNQFFKDRAFLGLFVGRSLKEKMSLHQIYTGESTPGTEAVTRGILKEMVSFEILVLASDNRDTGP